MTFCLALYIISACQDKRSGPPVNAADMCIPSDGQVCTERPYFRDRAPKGEYFLMEQNQALTTYDETLAVAGAVADVFARQQAFTAYQQRQPENTRRRQLADLRLFCAYL